MEKNIYIYYYLQLLATGKSMNYSQFFVLFPILSEV